MIPEIPAKTIVSGFSDGNWFGGNYNMNIYKGCCHGCIYCDSRSDCYRIEDFDTVRAKRGALALIERDLRAKRKTGLLHTGAMSDPYNPFERELCLTRGALALTDRYGFGFVAATKSTLVTRDIDLLRSVRRHSPAAVNLTITTADDALCRKLERNVDLSSARFAALTALADAGIPCGVLLMPILPFINDTAENILQITRRARESGAKWVYAHHGFGVTLRANQRAYFLSRLDAAFPGLRRRYEETFGEAYECHSPDNAALWTLFTAASDRLGLAYRMEDIIRALRAGYDGEQITLESFS
jgi:DNA repair photolyase